MADSSTVARPYAKAIFEFARDNKELESWSEALKILALVAQDANTLSFIHNPASTSEQQTELLLAVLDAAKLSADKTLVANFISALAENQRLQILPEIFLRYEAMRSNFEKTIEVFVVSYAKLTKSQEENLIERLTKRLQRKVALNVTVDKSLQGGAIIRAGHLVFDASVGTQIKNLSGTVAA